MEFESNDLNTTRPRADGGGTSANRKSGPTYPDVTPLHQLLMTRYPGLTQEQIRGATMTLLRYAEIAIAIVEEHERSGDTLTDTAPVPTMKERSNADLKT